MRVVVTGKAGQVVSSLLERGRAVGHVIITVGRPELDLSSGDVTAIRTVLAAVEPDAIVNAAAFTAVDQAETEPETAFAVNARGAGMVAEAAASLGVPLVQLSTDYVFSGDKATPYSEDDPTAPHGVYGASKLAGEKMVLDAQPDSAVLRTAWVYSPYGSNFVRTMLRLARTSEEIRVVADQRGNPTSALDIADAVLAVAENLCNSSDPARRGVFHMAGLGEADWSDFAKAIFAESSARCGPSARVRGISTADYPTLARRPANSRLDCSKLELQHGVILPDWRQALPQVVGRLLANVWQG